MTFPLLTKDLRSEFELRIDKVRNAMIESDADAVLIGSTVNIFYLSGGIFRGYIYIPASGDPLIFMIPPAMPSSDDQTAIHKPEQIPALLESHGVELPGCVALEFDDLYYSEIERLKKLFPGAGVCNASRIMRAARLTKTDFEIALMREDGLKHCAVYSRIGRCYREGMTDIEFQIEVENVLRRGGCLGFLRTAGSRMEINMGSVLAGPNADVPSPYDFSMGGGGVSPSLPVGACGEIMKPGMVVMVDMNGGFNGYQTDMTRCWAIGNVSDLAKKAHECSRTILRDLESFARPRTEAGELYRRAHAIAEREGLSEYFMGHRHKVAFIGHGVGIELNEGPVIMERNKSPLMENMTIALEPKFVVPEAGAVGVENTYVVTSDGLLNLTSMNENLDEL